MQYYPDYPFHAWLQLCNGLIFNNSHTFVEHNVHKTLVNSWPTILHRVIHGIMLLYIEHSIFTSVTIDMCGNDAFPESYSQPPSTHLSSYLTFYKHLTHMHAPIH